MAQTKGSGHGTGQVPMKLSDLITELQRALETHGDGEVVYSDSIYGYEAPQRAAWIPVAEASGPVFVLEP